MATGKLGMPATKSWNLDIRDAEKALDKVLKGIGSGKAIGYSAAKLAKLQHIDSAGIQILLAINAYQYGHGMPTLDSSVFSEQIKESLQLGGVWNLFPPN